MAHPPAPAPAAAAALSHSATTQTESITGFIFVKIPVGRRHDEADPLHRREDTIDQMLRSQGLGLVVGWGDSLGERRPDGQRPAAHIRIDINANDVQATRSALRALLPTLGAPEVYLQWQEGLIDADGNIGANSRAFLQGWMDRFVAWVRLHNA